MYIFFAGSFLCGLFRAVFPILKKGSSALGHELLNSGIGVINDAWKTGDLKAAQKNRGKQFISNVSDRISNHMFGSGYTSTLGTKRAQSKRVTKPKKTSKITKKKPAKSKVVKKKKTVKKKNVKKQQKNDEISKICRTYSRCKFNQKHSQWRSLIHINHPLSRPS